MIRMIHCAFLAYITTAVIAIVTIGATMNSAKRNNYLIVISYCIFFLFGIQSAAAPNLWCVSGALGIDSLLSAGGLTPHCAAGPFRMVSLFILQVQFKD